MSQRRAPPSGSAWLLAAMTAGGAPSVLAAPPPLPADFLEYLGSWEADDADWMVARAAAQVAQPPAAPTKPPAPLPTSRGYSTTSTPPPAQTTTERKP